MTKSYKKAVLYGIRVGRNSKKLRIIKKAIKTRRRILNEIWSQVLPGSNWWMVCDKFDWEKKVDRT